jgi:mycothiol system anti-sigma-R factor
MSNYELTPCNQILNSFVLLLEGNTDLPMVHTIEIHLSECPDCAQELAHEKKMRDLLQNVLRRTCCESAPDELHDSIYQQIHAQMAGAFTTGVTTEFKMTEISIEIDEFGNVEHREITIEHTEEIRYLNDGSDGDGK